MKRTAVILVFALAAVPPAIAGADEAMSAMPGQSVTHGTQVMGRLPASLQGKPVVVRVHADWCPACKATRETYEGIRREYAGKASFVTLDVTDGKTATAAAQLAKKDGIASMFAADKTKTSTVAVIDPRTGAIVTSLYNDNDPADYRKAIDAVAASLAK